MSHSITPIVSAAYNVGAILYDTWGCEQTNVDFYCIIERKGQYVTILPMEKEVIKIDGFMSYIVKPSIIDTTAKPIRKKVKSYSGEESGFTLRSYAGGGWCNLWNGKPKNETHYA